MVQAEARGRLQALRWLGQEQKGQRAQRPTLQGRFPAGDRQAEAHFH
jgi:hypothetical protein